MHKPSTRCAKSFWLSLDLQACMNRPFKVVAANYGLGQNTRPNILPSQRLVKSLMISRLAVSRQENLTEPLGLLARMSSTTCLPFSAFRDAMTTSAPPLDASTRAAARPMPLVALVRMAVFPACSGMLAMNRSYASSCLLVAGTASLFVGCESLTFNPPSAFCPSAPCTARGAPCIRARRRRWS